MSKEEALQKIHVSITSYSKESLWPKTQGTLETPSDKELGVTINKILHSYKSDFIILRRVIINE